MNFRVLNISLVAVTIVLLATVFPNRAVASASVTITTDKPLYVVGETIRLTVNVQNSSSTSAVSGWPITFTDDNATGTIRPPNQSTNEVGRSLYDIVTTNDMLGVHTLTVTAHGDTAGAGTATANASFTVMAATTTPSTPATTTPSSDTPTPAATQSSEVIPIPNPIACTDATCLVSQVIRYILGVIAIIATLMFVWGGVMMLTSGGNAEQVKKAKETLVWATIGVIVILLSWVIIKFVLQGLVGTK